MDNIFAPIFTGFIALICVYLGFRHDKQNKTDAEIKRLGEAKADNTKVDKVVESIERMETKRREDVKSIYDDIKGKADKNDLTCMENRIMDAIRDNNTAIQNTINMQNKLITEIHGVLMNKIK